MALKVCGMSCTVNLHSSCQFVPVCSGNNSELVTVLVQKCLCSRETVSYRPEMCWASLYLKLDNFVLEFMEFYCVNTYSCVQFFWNNMCIIQQ
jgi:hypothetical protein